jgi:hypothetical protein
MLVGKFASSYRKGGWNAEPNAAPAGISGVSLESSSAALGFPV